MCRRLGTIGSRSRHRVHYSVVLRFVVVASWLCLFHTVLTILPNSVEKNNNSGRYPSPERTAPLPFAAGFVVAPTTTTVRSGGYGHDAFHYGLPSIAPTPDRVAPNATPTSSCNRKHSRLQATPSGSDDEPPVNNNNSNVLRLITADPQRSVLFSVLMSACGAGLGPFLDSYHSAFGVLQYDAPLRWTLWGSETYPALTTTWWVPELFGLAGFLIGWLYIVLDAVLLEPSDDRRRPAPPKTLVGISFFTLQYWLSGILVQTESLDRTGILNFMSVLAAVGFWVLDGTVSGLLVSGATAVGGPLIEAGLITATAHGLLSSGYHYTDLGETGFFPLWIVPVYFLGGPANGNLARGFWNVLSNNEEDEWNNNTPKTNTKTKPKTKANTNQSCDVCQGTRRSACPNCDGVGTYVAMGNRVVKCTSCNARGFVMCRACFDSYDDDPYDLEGIRDIMNRMPD